MSDLYPITAPVVKADGADLTQSSVQIAFNTLTAAIRIALNQIAVASPVGPAGGDLSGTYPNPTVAAVHATAGTLDGVTVGGIVPEPGTFTTLAATTANFVTQNPTDNSTLAATDAFVNRQIIRNTAAVPLSVVGGTYSTFSAGTGLQVVIFALSGPITSILSIVTAGTGYAVGDVLVVAGGNYDARIRVTAIGAGGSVTTTQVIYGGSGYTTGAQVGSIEVPPGERLIILTGALTSNVLYVLSAGTRNDHARRPVFVNNTTGAFTVTVKLSDGAGGILGAGVLLPQGSNNSTSVTLETDGVTDVWLSNPVGGIGAVGLGTFAAPPAIGNTTPNSGAFTTLTASTPIGIASGGTGAASAGAARTALGAAASGANSDITSLTGLTTALSVAQGGTGRQTLTTHGVLVGEGTAAINQTAVGTTGQMLIGATGADPAFGNAAVVVGGTVDNTPIGNTTASSVKATTVSATGTITPSTTNGIAGTTLADNANAGSVGEVLTSTVSGVGLTSGANTTIATIQLTPGDWDIFGNVQFVPAAGTTFTIMATAISSTTNAISASLQSSQVAGTADTGIAQVLPPPTVRMNVSVNTNVFLIGAATFGVSTLTANGIISARRAR